MEPNELKSLLDAQKRAHNELTQTLEAQRDEIKKIGHAHADTVAKLEKLADVVAELETKLSRPAPVQPQQKDPAVDKELPIEVKAFEKFLRYGRGRAMDRMTDEEKAAWHNIAQKSLSESDDARGGFTVPEDVRTEVIRRIPYFSGIGALVDRGVTSRDVARWPRLTGGNDIASSAMAVTYEDETDEVSETDFTMGSAAIPIRKARTLVKVSNDLLEDTAVDIVGLITGLAAEAFGQDEEFRIVAGSGPKVPAGFMTDDQIGSVPSGSASSFDWLSLVSLIAALPEQYAKNARLLFRRKTFGELLKMKDGEDRPLWVPSVASGAPATIFGYPYSIVEYMPEVSSNGFPFLFGDLRRLYLALDRVGMSVRRLDEKYAETDETGFIFRRRWGGRVMQPWAAKKMKIAAS